MNDYAFLRKEYPPIISSEQLRKILHVSKRKCVWMLQTGLIPCIDTHKKSRRYQIELEHVISFLIRTEEQPTGHYIEESSIRRESMLIAPILPPDGFRESLENEWHSVPDMLTIKK